MKLQISENRLTDNSITYDVIITSDDNIRITIECMCEYDAEQLVNSLIGALIAAHVNVEECERATSEW